MKHRLSIVRQAFRYIGLRALFCGAGCGAIVGTLLFPVAPLAGAVAGVFVGILIASPLGCLSGIVLGLVTTQFFNPVENSRHFRMTMTVMGSLVGFVGAYLGFSILFWSGDPTFRFYFNLVLALIVTICSIYVSSSYANRYLEQYGQLRKEGIAQ